ncbi:hypothetical protein SNEBB_004825 [Seison nebaliae]|nr:hypothetical protein SNEBB_004825 [Seison nebaliae]
MFSRIKTKLKEAENTEDNKIFDEAFALLLIGVENQAVIFTPDILIDAAELAVKFNNLKAAQQCLDIYFSGNRNGDISLHRGYLVQYELIAISLITAIKPIERLTEISKYLTKAINIENVTAKNKDIIFRSFILFWDSWKTNFYDGTKRFTVNTLKQFQKKFLEIKNCPSHLYNFASSLEIEGKIDEYCYFTNREGNDTNEISQLIDIFLNRTQNSVQSTNIRRRIISIVVTSEIFSLNVFLKKLTETPFDYIYACIVILTHMKISDSMKIFHAQWIIEALLPKGIETITSAPAFNLNYQLTATDRDLIELPVNDFAVEVPNMKIDLPPMETNDETARIMIELAYFLFNGHHYSLMKKIVDHLTYIREKLNDFNQHHLHYLKTLMLMKKIGKYQRTYSDDMINTRVNVIEKLTQYIADVMDKFGNDKYHLYILEMNEIYGILETGCSLVWNTVQPLLQKGVRKKLKKSLVSVTETLKTIKSNNRKLRCKLHIECAKILYDEDAINAGIKHVHGAWFHDVHHEHTTYIRMMGKRMCYVTDRVEYFSHDRDIARTVLENLRTTDDSRQMGMAKNLLMKCCNLLGAANVEMMWKSENSVTRLLKSITKIDETNLPDVYRIVNEYMKTVMKAQHYVGMEFQKILKIDKTEKDLEDEPSPSTITTDITTDKTGKKDDSNDFIKFFVFGTQSQLGELAEDFYAWADIAQSARRRDEWEIVRISTLYCLLYDDTIMLENPIVDETDGMVENPVSLNYNDVDLTSKIDKHIKLYEEYIRKPHFNIVQLPISCLFQWANVKESTPTEEDARGTLVDKDFPLELAKYLAVLKDAKIVKEDKRRILRSLGEMHLLRGESLIHLIKLQKLKPLNYITNETMKQNAEVLMAAVEKPASQLSINIDIGVAQKLTVESKIHQLNRSYEKNLTQWFAYKYWLEWLGNAAVMHFNRAMQIALLLDENWLNINALTYTWNYYYHLFRSFDISVKERLVENSSLGQEYIFRHLSKLNDTLLTCFYIIYYNGFGTNVEHYVCLARMVIKCTFARWKIIDYDTVELYQIFETQLVKVKPSGIQMKMDKNEAMKNVSKERLTDLKLALTICEEVLLILESDKLPHHVLDYNYRMPLIKYWVILKIELQQPIKVKLLWHQLRQSTLYPIYQSITSPMEHKSTTSSDIRDVTESTKTLKSRVTSSRTGKFHRSSSNATDVSKHNQFEAGMTDSCKEFLSKLKIYDDLSQYSVALYCRYLEKSRFMEKRKFDFSQIPSFAEIFLNYQTSSSHWYEYAPDVYFQDLILICQTSTLILMNIGVYTPFTENPAVLKGLNAVDEIAKVIKESKNLNPLQMMFLAAQMAINLSNDQSYKRAIKHQREDSQNPLINFSIVHFYLAIPLLGGLDALKKSDNSESLFQTNEINRQTQLGFNALLKSIRYGLEASNYDLVINGARCFWNSVVNIIPSNKRYLLLDYYEKISEILKENHVKFPNGYLVTLENSKMSGMMSNIKTNANSKGLFDNKDAFDDLTLRVIYYVAILRVYQQRCLWQKSLDLLQDALPTVPRSHRLELTKFLIISKSKLGQGVQFDMHNLREQSIEYIALMWITVAVASRNHFDHLCAVKNAVQILDGVHSHLSTVWQKIFYSIDDISTKQANECLRNVPLENGDSETLELAIRNRSQSELQNRLTRFEIIIELMQYLHANSFGDDLQHFCGIMLTSSLIHSPLNRSFESDDYQKQFVQLFANADKLSIWQKSIVSIKKLPKTCKYLDCFLRTKIFLAQYYYSCGKFVLCTEAIVTSIVIIAYIWRMALTKTPDKDAGGSRRGKRQRSNRKDSGGKKKDYTISSLISLQFWISYNFYSPSFENIDDDIEGDGIFPFSSENFGNSLHTIYYLDLLLDIMPKMEFELFSLPVVYLQYHIIDSFHANNILLRLRSMLNIFKILLRINDTRKIVTYRNLIENNLSNFIIEWSNEIRNSIELTSISDIWDGEHPLKEEQLSRLTNKGSSNQKFTRESIKKIIEYRLWSTIIRDIIEYLPERKVGICRSIASRVLVHSINLKNIISTVHFNVILSKIAIEQEQRVEEGMEIALKNLENSNLPDVLWFETVNLLIDGTASIHSNTKALLGARSITLSAIETVKNLIQKNMNPKKESNLQTQSPTTETEDVLTEDENLSLNLGNDEEYLECLKDLAFFLQLKKTDDDLWGDNIVEMKKFSFNPSTHPKNFSVVYRLYSMKMKLKLKLADLIFALGIKGDDMHSINSYDNLQQAINYYRTATKWFWEVKEIKFYIKTVLNHLSLLKFMAKTSDVETDIKSNLLVANQLFQQLIRNLGNYLDTTTMNLTVGSQNILNVSDKTEYHWDDVGANMFFSVTTPTLRLYLFIRYLYILHLLEMYEYEQYINAKYNYMNRNIRKIDIVLKEYTNDIANDYHFLRLWNNWLEIFLTKTFSELVSYEKQLKLFPNNRLCQREFIYICGKFFRIAAIITSKNEFDEKFFEDAKTWLKEHNFMGIDFNPDSPTENATLMFYSYDLMVSFIIQSDTLRLDNDLTSMVSIKKVLSDSSVKGYDSSSLLRIAMNQKHIFYLIAFECLTKCFVKMVVDLKGVVELPEDKCLMKMICYDLMHLLSHFKKYPKLAVLYMSIYQALIVSLDKMQLLHEIFDEPKKSLYSTINHRILHSIMGMDLHLISFGYSGEFYGRYVNVEFTPVNTHNGLERFLEDARLNSRLWRISTLNLKDLKLLPHLYKKYNATILQIQHSHDNRYLFFGIYHRPPFNTSSNSNEEKSFCAFRKVMYSTNERQEINSKIEVWKKALGTFHLKKKLNEDTIRMLNETEESKLNKIILEEQFINFEADYQNIVGQMNNYFSFAFNEVQHQLNEALGDPPLHDKFAFCFTKETKKKGDPSNSLEHKALFQDLAAEYDRMHSGDYPEVPTFVNGIPNYEWKEVKEKQANERPPPSVEITYSISLNIKEKIERLLPLFKDPPILIKQPDSYENNVNLILLVDKETMEWPLENINTFLKPTIVGISRDLSLFTLLNRFQTFPKIPDSKQEDESTMTIKKNSKDQRADEKLGWIVDPLGGFDRSYQKDTSAPINGQMKEFLSSLRQYESKDTGFYKILPGIRDLTKIFTETSFIFLFLFNKLWRYYSYESIITCNLQKTKVLVLMNSAHLNPQLEDRGMYDDGIREKTCNLDKLYNAQLFWTIAGVRSAITNYSITNVEDTINNGINFVDHFLIKGGSPGSAIKFGKQTSLKEDWSKEAQRFEEEFAEYIKQFKDEQHKFLNFCRDNVPEYIPKEKQSKVKQPSISRKSRLTMESSKKEDDTEEDLDFELTFDSFSTEVVSELDDIQIPKVPKINTITLKLPEKEDKQFICVGVPFT